MYLCIKEKKNIIEMRGGRIEISYAEYRYMDDKIKELQAEIVELNKKIEIQNSIIEDLEEKNNNLSESGLFERFFKWNKILKENK